MCCVQPILACVDSSSDSQKSASWFKNSAPEDIIRCCDSMRNEPIFAPARSIGNAAGQPLQLYYMKREEVFLLIVVNDRDKLPRIDIVQASDTVESNLRAKAAATAFFNFVLHFIWTETIRFGSPSFR